MSPLQRPLFNEESDDAVVSLAECVEQSKISDEKGLKIENITEASDLRRYLCVLHRSGSALTKVINTNARKLLRQPISPDVNCAIQTALAHREFLDTQFGLALEKLNLFEFIPSMSEPIQESAKNFIDSKTENVQHKASRCVLLS